jgi:plastocyanin
MSFVFLALAEGEAHNSERGPEQQEVPVTRIPRISVVLALFGASVGVAPQRAEAVPVGPKLTVEVGEYIPSNLIDLQGMYPKTTVVNAGDSLSFDFRGFHNVAFRTDGKRVPFLVPTTNPPTPVGTVLDAAGKAFWFSNAAPTLGFNPAVFGPSANTVVDGVHDVNSGLLQPSFTASFPSPGTFDYFCEIHPFMNGSVVVKPSGVSTPSGTEQTAEGVEQLNRDLNRALDAQAELKDGDHANAHVAAITPDNGDDHHRGTTVLVGSGTRKFSLLEFFPVETTVHIGETVKFQWEGFNEPHTVTFGPEALRMHLEENLFGPQGADPQGFFPSEPPSNPPTKPQRIDVSPTTHGDGFANSGALFDPPAGPAPHSFKVRFTKRGRYDYECLIHAGMDGVINVV